MEHKDVVNALIEIVKGIQIMSGRTYTDLKEGSNVYAECPDFDSHNSVEATCAIERQLGVELPFNNVFFDDPKVLNIGQAAARILEAIE